MNIINILHLIFLNPLESFFIYILDFSLSHIHNYGLSIIILSFFITLITTPLYYLAERWKAEEKNLQANMKNDLESISNHYQGQKKFYLTKTTHRLFGYKWYHTLKTSFGLLIQIPFFFAAYNVLSSYTPFYGKSFFILKDLGQTDALLDGVNLLPFLMSFINIAYSFYYTRAKNIQENKEQLIMAGIFFVLLYNSPSALLLYWTFNNIFSFIKGVLFRKLNLEHSIVQEKIDLEQQILIDTKTKQCLQKVYKREIIPVASFFLLVAVQIGLIIKNSDFFRFYIAFSYLLALLLICISIKKKKQTFNTFNVFLFVSSTTLFCIYLLKINISFMSNRGFRIFILLFYDFIIWYCAKKLYSSNAYTRPDLNQTSLVQIYFLLASLTIHILVLKPLIIYISDIKSFDLNFSTFLLFCFKHWFFLFTSIGFILFLLKKKYKEYILTLLVFISLTTLFYSLFFILDIGLLDSYEFINATEITHLSFTQLLFDSIVLISLVYISKFIYKNYKKFIFIISVFLLLSPLFSFIENIKKHDFSLVGQFRKIHMVNNNLPENTQDRHTFSKNGKNIIFIMADMFNGNYLKKMIEEDNSYYQKLEGFTYFYDTLSVSSHTISSLPAILAGESYLPIIINSNNKTGYENVGEAANILFSKFSKNNYIGLVANPIFFSEKHTAEYATENIYDYEHYWREKNGYKITKENKDKNGFIFLFSLFSSSPWATKNILYDNANWLFFQESKEFVSSQNHAIRELAYLDLLPEICTTTENGDIFFYLDTELPHGPWGIDFDGNPIRSTFSGTESQAAFLSAKKTIDTLIQWFDWMKTNEVWNNSLIVIVSDHGNKTQDNEILLPKSISNKVTREDVSKAHALLMYKPFNGKENLIIDYRLMTNADAPSLLLIEAGINDKELKDPRNNTINRTRFFSTISSKWEDALTKTFVPYRNYEINGPIEEPSSWKLF